MTTTLLPRLRERSRVLMSPCSLVYTGSGDDVMVTDREMGYTFSGRREGVTAVTAADAKADYLLFGVWLDEADNGAGADTFGAIATGGQEFTLIQRDPLSKVKRRIAVPQSGPIIRRVAGCRLSMATPI